MKNKRKRLQERLSTRGASYYAKGASVSSPSTTEKTLTGLHNFSSTGWGMQQSPRESHLEIIDGILNSDSLLSNGKHPQMRETFRAYLRNLGDFAKQWKEERSQSFSSTTEKNTSAQATSLGVTSISTISSSPAKVHRACHTLYQEC